MRYTIWRPEDLVSLLSPFDILSIFFYRNYFCFIIKYKYSVCKISSWGREHCQQQVKNRQYKAQRIELLLDYQRSTYNDSGAINSAKDDAVFGKETRRREEGSVQMESSLSSI